MSEAAAPRFIAEVNLGGVSPEQYFAAAYQSLQKLGYAIHRLAHNGFTAGPANPEAISQEIRVILLPGKAVLKSETRGSAKDPAEWERNKVIVIQLANAIQQELNSSSPPVLIEKYNELSGQFNPRDTIQVIDVKLTWWDKAGDFLTLLKPVDGYFVTPVLIIINILIFLAMTVAGVHIIEPANDDLIWWQANYTPLTLAGEWWRLITCVFVHIGILHLILNMYALLYIGLLLEPYLGKLRFLVAYLLTGFAASVASLWWGESVLSAGASGAVFGMYGLFLALLSSNLIEKGERKPLLTSIGIFVVFNLVAGTRGHIDNAAHIGGLLSGIIIGYIYLPALKRPASTVLNYTLIAVSCILFVAGLTLVCRSVPNDIGPYLAKMDEFEALDRKASTVYDYPDSTPRDSLLYYIQRDGIDSYEKSLAFLSRATNMRLPARTKERNADLKVYAELKLKRYRLLYKAIDENTHDYDQLMKANNEKIDSVLSKINKDE